MKKSLTVAAALAVLSLSAQADGLSANVSVASKYKYRGQEQSDPDEYVVPAIQGGFDYTAGGFYVGNWNSSIGFAHGTEVDLYGGYKGEAGKLGYDVGVLTYYYPGSDVSSLNTTEVYGGLSYGIFTGKLSLTVSDKYFGIADASGTAYLDLGANYEFMAGTTLNLHVGYTAFSDGAKDLGAPNYVDYKIGATKDLGNGFSAAAAWVGANKDDAWGSVNKDRVVLSLTKSM